MTPDEQARRHGVLPPDTGAALVPAGLRPVVVVLTIVSALVVAVLGAVHHGSSAPSASDLAVARSALALWSPDALAYGIDGLVTVGPMLVILAALAAANLRAGRRRLALLALLAPLCVAGATTALKPLVGRTIHGDNLSFPSGHAGYATAVGLVLGLLLAGLARPTRSVQVALLLGPALVAGGLMALDQIVLDAHYPSDTVGGVATAVAVVLGLALGLDRLMQRRDPRPSETSTTTG